VTQQRRPTRASALAPRSIRRRKLRISFHSATHDLLAAEKASKLRLPPPPPVKNASSSSIPAWLHAKGRKGDAKNSSRE
jgi:hypothetical protein